MLSDTENRIHYECDGSTNSFPITFPYNDDSEIKVYLYNTVTMEDETLITSYNIIDNNVVTNETYSSDYRLTIVRELPLIQDTNLSSSGILPPEVIEERFDKLTMQIQQLQDQLDRTLIMHKSTTYSGLHLPEPENGFFLLWKDGDLINSQYLSSDAASITPYTKTLLDNDNASEALSTLGVSDYIKTLLDDIDAETARQTLGTDIYATIDFVNASLAASTLNLFLTDTASSEVSGYYEMLFTETGASGSSLTANSVSDGDLLWSFISPEFDVADQLSAGLYVISLWAEQDSNKTVTLTAKLYKRDSGGTETLLLETSTSDEIQKNIKTQIIMSGFLENDEAISSTDRVVLKIYANVSGGGGDPNITIYMEGTDDSRIAIRIPTSVITSKIFSADGNTYVEVTNDGIIHFATAGSERVTIDENGHILVSGTARIYNNGNLKVHNTIDFDSGEFAQIKSNNKSLNLNYGNSDNISLCVGGGKVGIRTIDPDTMLTLGNSTNTTYLKFNSERPWVFKADGSGGDTRLVLNCLGTGKWFVIQEAGTDRFKFLTNGKAYADDGWYTFSPVMPDKKGYEWLEVAKEDAYKPRKPDGLTMNEMTDEDIEKYGKDIAKIAMSNTRAIDYIAHVQRCILRSLINTRRMLYDIRQSTTKKSTN